MYRMFEKTGGWQDWLERRLQHWGVSKVGRSQSRHDGYISESHRLALSWRLI
jgi:hypothetical protein